MTKTAERRALALSYFTVAYNLVECLLALLAGYLAGSVALVGFGLDSLLETLSGGVLIWRFRPRRAWSLMNETAVAKATAEARLERRAVKIIGYTFFVLAAYIFYEAAQKLLFAEIPRPSLLGMGVALVSAVVMPALYLAKSRTGEALASGSLLADSKQSLACGALSVALLIGLGLNYLFGFWQADPLIGLLIALFLVREGHRTVKEEKLCTCAAGARPPDSNNRRRPPFSG